MCSDLVKRLRASVTYKYMPMAVRRELDEAAAEIERLRASQPQPVSVDREAVARALYEDWVKEEELRGEEYLSWDLLPDKATWRSRADADVRGTGLFHLHRSSFKETKEATNG